MSRIGNPCHCTMQVWTWTALFPIPQPLPPLISCQSLMSAFILKVQLGWSNDFSSCHANTLVRLKSYLKSFSFCKVGQTVVKSHFTLASSSTCTHLSDRNLPQCFALAPKQRVGYLVLQKWDWQIKMVAWQCKKNLWIRNSNCKTTCCPIKERQKDTNKRRLVFHLKTLTPLYRYLV